MYKTVSKILLTTFLLMAMVTPFTAAAFGKMMIVPSVKSSFTKVKKPALCGEITKGFQSYPVKISPTIKILPWGQEVSTVNRGELAAIMVDFAGFEINTEGGPHFSDVLVSHPYYEAIETVYNLGIMSPYTSPNGEPYETFGPEDGVNRAQVAKLMFLSAGLSLPAMVSAPRVKSMVGKNGECGFPQDVEEGDWYYDYVMTLYLNGVDVTDRNCQFHPGELAKMPFFKETMRTLGGEIE
jgi:hypothetical protein